MQNDLKDIYVTDAERTAGSLHRDGSAFSVGALWLTEYGFGYDLFYVAEICHDKIRLTMPDWLASSGVWMTRREMEARHAEYLGHGNRKWYWRFLPWRDCVTPVYMPNALPEPSRHDDARKTK
jgi:hypothetical protein